MSRSRDRNAPSDGQDRPRPIDFTDIDFGYAGVEYDLWRQWEDPEDYQYIDEVQLGKIDPGHMAETIVRRQQLRRDDFNGSYRELDSADVAVLTAILRSFDLHDDHFHAEIVPGYYGDELDGIYLECHRQAIDELWNDYLTATYDGSDRSREAWQRDHL